MLDEEWANDAIHEGMSLGADFVDLFVEKNVVSTLSFLDKKVD